MKLYYSTYGMQELDVFAALPRLRDMGYEGMEIAVTPGWHTDPTRFDTSARKKLAALLTELGFPTPPLMALLSPCATGEARASMLAQFAASFDMARDLRVSDEISVVATTLGHPQPFARRRVYDARLALSLRRQGVTEFATANVKDFEGFGLARVWNPLERSSRRG